MSSSEQELSFAEFQSALYRARVKVEPEDVIVYASHEKYEAGEAMFRLEREGFHTDECAVKGCYSMETRFDGRLDTETHELTFPVCTECFQEYSSVYCECDSGCTECVSIDMLVSWRSLLPGLFVVGVVVASVLWVVWTIVSMVM